MSYSRWPCELCRDRQRDCGRIVKHLGPFLLFLPKFLRHAAANSLTFASFMPFLPLSCQMAIAIFLDHMCLAVRASGLWLCYATLQNLIPSFPWIAPHTLNPGAIQGKEGIKFYHLATLHALPSIPPQLPPFFLHSPILFPDRPDRVLQHHRSRPKKKKRHVVVISCHRDTR